MRFIKKLIHENQGSALIFVLLILVVVSVLGLAIIGLSTSAFRITRIDADSESAYYIAEAGINHTIDLINTKINDLYDLIESEDEFFINLENFFETPFIIDDFEENFGRLPTATTTIAGSWNIGETSADYTLTSVGRIGTSSRIVTSVITVNWIKEEEMLDIDLEEVFMHGSQFKYNGGNINGAGGTIIFDEIDLRNNPSINVSNLFLNNRLNLEWSYGTLGNRNQPGKIYINDDLNLGLAGFWDVYGEVYINGNLKLLSSRVNDNVYVNGNLELGYIPQIGRNIYYTGELQHPNLFDSRLLNKCIKVDSIPSFIIPEIEIQLKDNSWYTANEYVIRRDVSENKIPNNTKMIVDSYYSDSRSPNRNTIIISKSDIIIRGNRQVEGVLIAPYGKVILEEGSFTGIILSKNGVVTEKNGLNINRRFLFDFFTEETLPIIISVNREDKSGEESETNKNRMLIKSPIKEK